jgi:hypothetical protein
MEDNEIKIKYAKKVKIRNTFTVLFILLSIVLFIIIIYYMTIIETGAHAEVITELIILLILAGSYFIIALIIAIFYRVNWRCPRCGSFLGRDFFSPKYCKSCGVKLR